LLSYVFLHRITKKCNYAHDTSTDKKPVGNVSVGSGKTVTLKANKEIMIKNGFSVESGGTFEMDVEQ